jgi:diguanylate cyclase (GGDEF)-like protein
VDWGRLPDFVAVTLLTCAFASVSRSGNHSVSRLWLTGWFLIALHFAASMLLSFPGFLGVIAEDVALVALVNAGFLFMYASVPYRRESSSQWMLVVLTVTNTAYICLINVTSPSPSILTVAAIAIGALPLCLALYVSRNFQHSLRWILVTLYGTLTVFLLAVQSLPVNGAEYALNGILFTVYFGCCLHVLYTYRRVTVGALITIVGFFAWAGVFVLAPLFDTTSPTVQIENEVWNLPKYVVAVGMILLLLEDQLEHNKYLALHDELTGLPNRRLFLDRLTQTIERCRRTGLKTALLVVDLDQFKQVNDSLGHHAGDLLLQKVGEVFTGRVRTADTVARTGGDEFSLILEDPGSRANAGKVADNLQQYLNEPMEIMGRRVIVGASVGVALFPDDATDIESLCIAADLKMYNQKNCAKEENRSHLMSGIPPQTESRDALIDDFRLLAERHRA